MVPELRDLDAGETLSLLESVVLERRRAEVDDLLLVLHYADLHAAIPADTAPGGETLGDLGGDGTPGVRELAVVELGIARGVHTHAARSVVADALDLRHRLPHTFDLVRQLHAEVWVARKVARMTRHLSYDSVGLVDRAVADAIDAHSPARVLDLAAAKTIEADQAAHDARVAAERAKRYVALTRIDDTGLRGVVARMTAGRAAQLHATLNDVADALAQHPDTREHHTGMGADELRAEALAWLARPVDAAALLAGEVDLHRERRTSTLYLHLSEAALLPAPGEPAGAVARVEGLGPHSLVQLAELLGHDRIVVKPVIDLHDQVSVTAYEHPESMKERIRLRWTHDAFPHATAAAGAHIALDYDHATPFDAHGPPGQTSSSTGQPLSRTAHRAKTHLAYRCVPLPSGEMLWTTPHGLHRLVDHTGTHHLTQADHDAWSSDDAMDRALVRLTHRLRTGALQAPVHQGPRRLSPR